MAVLPFLPGLEVEIIVNDVPLSEYDNDSDTPASPTTITKYVKATSGAHFAIKITLTEAFPFPKGDVQACISLDGRWLMGRIVREAQFFGSKLTMGRLSQIGQHSKIQRLCLAELEISKFNRRRNCDMPQLR